MSKPWRSAVCVSLVTLYRHCPLDCALKGLPLSQANLLTFDLMPIGPLLPLGMLMKAK